MNHLAEWTNAPAECGAGFDHPNGWAIRFMHGHWTAWRGLMELVLEKKGDDWRPRHFPSAAAAARYLKEHPDAD